MKNIKTFEQFINDAFKSNNIDIKTQMFCEGRISEIEYYEYLNEGLFDDFKNWLSDVAFYTFDWFQKLGNVLLTLLKNVAKFAINIGEKVIGAIKWIFNKIKDWAEKHPVAFRVIVITIIVFIILIVCCASAYAQSKGGPPPSPFINTAIGWLRDLNPKDGGDPTVRMKAIAWLVDLKNGTTHDASVYGAEAIQLAKVSMKTAAEGIKPDSGISPEYLMGLAEKGSEITKYYISEGAGHSRVILGN
jgi:hypothetical protein